MRTCSKCGKERETEHRYCRACHAEHMRLWRKTHPLTEDQKFKDNCRSYANVYLRRGKIKQEACQRCGCVDSQMHHPDYTKPLEIEWYCRACHLSLHKLL